MQLNETFKKQILQSQASLKQFAYSYTNDYEAADDLLQDTMVKALRYHEQYQEGTNIRGWLFTIMRNTFINGYRKNTRKNEIVSTEDDITSAQLLQSAVKNNGDAKFVRKDIDRAISKVPEAYTVPFLRYFEGYKYHEIAEELNIPIGTVKTRIHMARQMLQKQLKAYRK